MFQGQGHLFILAPLLGLFAFIARILVYYFFASRRPTSFPPGPSTLPFLGNLHQLPISKGFLKFHNWGKEYGSIIGLKLGPQNVVVLNNYKHVKELFDKRGSLYSSRPDSFVGNELICPNETHILLLPYGPGWRRQRKTVQALLNVTTVDDMLPIQNAEATQTLIQILQDPANYYDHIRRYSTAVILASVFGQRGPRFDSPNVQALYHAQDRFTAIMETGATPPVDAFPFLKKLPEFLCSWKREAKAIRQEQRSLYSSLLNETKKRLEKKDLDCFMARLIREQEKSGFDDEHLAYLGGILMEAGSDTTASTLLSFILALTTYPEVLRKAQKELDDLCGGERSPTIEDFGKLPYLTACMTETLRWRPVAAGGIPHVLVQDDTYDQYVLPKGTMLFANTWAIHRDEDEYAQPEEFIPERFLSNKFGTRSKETSQDDHRRVTYGFGAGRRVCPGQRLAENSLIVNMAKLVWAYDITTEASVVDVDVETAYTPGFLTTPLKFPARFVPRSPKHKAVIEREFEVAKAFLAQFEG